MERTHLSPELSHLNGFYRTKPTEQFTVISDADHWPCQFSWEPLLSLRSQNIQKQPLFCGNQSNTNCVHVLQDLFIVYWTLNFLSHQPKRISGRFVCTAHPIRYTSLPHRRLRRRLLSLGFPAHSVALCQRRGSRDQVVELELSRGFAQPTVAFCSGFRAFRWMLVWVLQKRRESWGLHPPTHSCHPLCLRWQSHGSIFEGFNEKPR